MLRHFLFLFFFFAISFQFNQLAAQWQQTTAPKDPSGVYALSCHANYLYAGISSHGVYISTDQGMSWTAKNDGLFNYSIRDFAFIDNNIFVATRGAGVFRSVESEISWTSASSGLSDLEVYALTVKGTKLFAGSGGSMQAGVYMSNDIANSWVKVSNGLTLPAPVRALASDGQYLYTGIYGTGDGSGIFYSSNDVVLNELMYTPSSGEPEWIELFNKTDSPLNLKKWRIKDLTTTTTITNNDIIIPPASFIILTDDSTIINFYNISSEIIQLNLPSLNNTGDAIAIIDSLGVLIDSVLYSPNCNTNCKGTPYVIII